MAKKVKVCPIPTIEKGKFLQVPEFNENGIPIMGAGRPKTRDGNIIDILETLINSFPSSQLTMANITEGIRLKNQLDEAKEKSNGFLILEDSTYDWAKKMLENENVGVKLLAFNLPNVLKAIGEES